MSINKKVKKALEVLELTPGASMAKIKKSFRSLAMKYHPDKCCEKDREYCKEKFVEIIKAREYLECYYTGNYKYIDEKKQKKKVEEYKYYVEHFKRFYEGFW
ncbi:MAG: DnaJ domain-containing protein [Endomicrobiales bacterium]|nr:DnaJ domain-containing protein [Endomicrobiales bacterium]